MNRYRPGNAFRASLIFEIAGVLVDPTSPSVTLFLPGPSGTTIDGTTTTVTPIQDSVGMWHADLLVPFGTPKGIGVYRGRSQGSLPDQNALEENRFEVVPLGG